VSVTPAILHLSLVTSGELTDADGRKLGRIEDLVVRLSGEEYPPISGAVAKVAGRLVFVPAEQIGELDHGRIKLAKARLDLQPFERREGELLLREDLLDRQLINVDGARLVRANEIEIARVEGWWRVVGIDVNPQGLLRRLLPRAVAPRVGVSEFLDWASLEPFTGHIPTIRLRVPHPKLARLHPAELADLVEAAPHGQGEEILVGLHPGRIDPMPIEPGPVEGGMLAGIPHRVADPIVDDPVQGFPVCCLDSLVVVPGRGHIP